MKISDLDYYATFGNTFLHKVSAQNKLLSLTVIIFAVLTFRNIYFYGILYFLLLMCLIFSGVPKRKSFTTSLYPLIFTVVFLYSYENLSAVSALTLVFRVMCISTSFILLIFTTPYVKIFGALSNFLPKILLNILFNTYRSLFIINNTLDSLLTTIRLRGKLGISRPVFTLKTIGNLVGFFVIKSIETSEKMQDGIKLRGYSEKFLALKDR